MPVGDPVLRLAGAAIGYDGPPVVVGADLSVGRGEVVAILGANGSGKSTLVKGVLGLARVSAGTVELFGAPADRFAERWRVGYVPQRHTVAGGVPATVTEVVSAGRLSRRRPWQRLTGDDRRAVADAVATVGLADRRTDPVATLSGGQQRRVLVARALASGPELLMLDEPSAGVDTASQDLMADTLAGLVASGATVVLITHDLGPARPVVTRSVVMAGGRIVYDGPPAAAPSDPDHRDRHHPDQDPDRRPAIGLTG